MEVSALHTFGGIGTCSNVTYHACLLTCNSFNSLNKSACLLARCFAKLDVLTPLVCADLKRLLHTALVVSVG